jgi:hypothetical protein
MPYNIFANLLGFVLSINKNLCGLLLYNAFPFFLNFVIQVMRERCRFYIIEINQETVKEFYINIYIKFFHLFS